MKDLYFTELKTEVEKIWWSLPSKYDNFKIRYNTSKDSALKNLNKGLIAHMNAFTSGNAETNLNTNAINSLKEFVVKHLEFSQHAVDTIVTEQYFKCSEEFIKRAKLLDKSINQESIFQALRNVWTMHSMQLYLGKEIELTNSVFAYSMLYPLTDNLLDDKSLSKADKLDFNSRFRIKINTGHGKFNNKREEQIFHMIDLIESDWDRKDYPKVYEALLAILDGQNLSLKQHNNMNIYNDDILGISIYKGGTSVLADAYLVNGSISYTDEKFAFFYGVILQFADDLQDILEDLKAGHITIMNLQSKLGNLDDLLCKYLNLIDYFLDIIYATESKEQIALKELTEASVQLLVFAAVLKNKKLVSKPLYIKIKNGSFFSPKHYNKSEKNLNRQLNKLILTF